MTPSIRIRRGTAADIQAILRHRLGMLTEMRIGELADYDAYTSEFKEFAISAIQSGTFNSWLAETDAGKIVAGGAVYLVPWPGNPEERKQQRAFLLNVFTEPKFRRQGIARMVVQAMVEWCRAEGFRSVRLMASEFGRPLYHSMGFLPTAEMRLAL